MHWPAAWAKGTLGCPDFGVSVMDTWKAMEALVDQGLVRSIGVSNFGPKRIKDLLEYARIKPVVNQLELHPLLAQTELVKFCSDSGIQCVAWSPLAKFASQLMHSHVVLSIAEKMGISPSQLVLRWNVQRGVAVIPRSTSADHIAENLQVANIEISDEDMASLSKLDFHCRVTRDWVGVFEETPYFPYHFIGYICMAVGFIFWMFVPHIFDFKNPQKSFLEVIATHRRVTWPDRLRIVFFLAVMIYRLRYTFAPV